MRFCFFSWFFKNSELIRDSPLWHLNFIPSTCDSVIIIGSGSVTYTVGLRFIYKRRVRVSIKIRILAFLGKYSNIICWVSKHIDWGSHQILYYFHQKRRRRKVLLHSSTSLDYKNASEYFNHIAPWNKYGLATSFVVVNELLHKPSWV